MNAELKAFKQAFAQAKAEGRWFAPLIHTVKGVRDPLSVYRSLSRFKLGGETCLMESVTHNGEKGRFSYICMGDDFTHHSYICNIHDLDRFKDDLRKYSPPKHPVLPYTGGPVGYLSFGISTLNEETIKLHQNDPFGLPLGEFYCFRRVIVFDHAERQTHYIFNMPSDYNRGKDLSETYSIGCVSIEQLEREGSREYPAPRVPIIGPVHSNMTQKEYHQMVLKGKKYVENGDVFQVVLSQRFSAKYRTNHSEGYGLTLYEKLKELNPSPYMFHMRFGSRVSHRLSLIGASPEIAVRIENREMTIRPIAGTRKRGATPKEDKRLAVELKNDPKELAEHRMLVDLARNDIGRYCKADSITIPELMKVELYRNVMHRTSEVRGRLRNGVHLLDACIGAHPQGTVSGAPKIRAQQIITELEKSGRGLYGGTFGWMTDYAMNTCIFIRSAMLRNGKLYWQSGGGIVADSDPESEYQESLAKACPIETALMKIGKH